MSDSEMRRRREFRLQSAAVMGSWALPFSFRRLLASPVRTVVSGGLRPVADETTGLPLLKSYSEPEALADDTVGFG